MLIHILIALRYIYWILWNQLIITIRTQMTIQIKLWGSHRKIVTNALLTFHKSKHSNIRIAPHNVCSVLLTYQVLRGAAVRSKKCLQQRVEEGWWLLNEPQLQTEIRGDVSIVLCGCLPRDWGLMCCGETTKFRLIVFTLLGMWCHIAISIPVWVLLLSIKHNWLAICLYEFLS